MSGPRPVVFVVDDDPSFLTAVSRLLRAAGFEVEPFSAAAELVARLRGDAAGCVVADLRMPGLDGLALQEALGRAGCPIPLVFLSGQADVPAAASAPMRGAEDFLTKTAPKEDLLDAVARALSRSEREREEGTRRLAQRALFARLTSREQEVLAHVVQGRLNKQIASRLDLHERTVKLHRTHLTVKLGRASVAELTRWAQEAGLLPELDRIAKGLPKGQ